MHCASECAHMRCQATACNRSCCGWSSSFRKQCVCDQPHKDSFNHDNVKDVFQKFPCWILHCPSPPSSNHWRFLNPRRAFKPCAEFIFRHKQTRIGSALANIHSPHLCFHDPHCVLSGNAQGGCNVLACHHSAFPRSQKVIHSASKKMRDDQQLSDLRRGNPGLPLGNRRLCHSNCVCKFLLWLSCVDSQCFQLCQNITPKKNNSTTIIYIQ